MEIKFRAWDKNKNEMHSAHNPYISQFLACKIADELVAENKRMMKEEDKKFIFMQLTWLLDKNWKEIYEWDIFQYDKCLRYVKYRKDNLSFMAIVIKWENSYWKCNFYLKDIKYYLDKIEIIWNIYQNKDLLDN